VRDVDRKEISLKPGTDCNPAVGNSISCNILHHNLLVQKCEK
jgi:hypothetical protein